MCGRPEEIAPPLILGKACLEALGTPLQVDKDLPREALFVMYDVGLKIQRAIDDDDDDLVELTTDEVVMLKNRIVAYYLPALIVAQALRMLETGGDNDE